MSAVQGFVTEDIRALFLAKIESSGLNLADAARLDFYVLNSHQVTELALWNGYARPPAMCIPYTDPWGDYQNYARYRALRLPAGAKADKFPKYTQPKGSIPHAYFPTIVTRWPKLLADPTKPIIITEGELKAAKACKEGFPTVSIGGVWSFGSKRRQIDFLPELDRVVWADRTVFIAYDSDTATNDKVARAEQALANHLIDRGAIVMKVLLPRLGNDKTGLDDFLVERGAEALRRVLGEAAQMEFEWRLLYQYGDNGPVNNVTNIRVALREAPELREIFAFDLMTQTVVLTGAIPDETPRADRRFVDSDVTTVQAWIQRDGELSRVGQDMVRAAIEERARHRSFHPVVDWLNGLPPWDQVLRTETWLGSIFGIPVTDYTRAASRMFLIAMVARVLAPGCKMDYMLILEGAQGTFKSSVFEELAGGWFSDGMPHLGGDDVRLAMHLRGKWLIEMSELATIKRAEIEDVKKFLSRREEIYTPKFGRAEVHEPRQCVFAGTTNKFVYLKDDGNRRFWPMRVPDGLIDRGWLAPNRDQLFAEALHRYRAGEAWYPDPELEARLFVSEQTQRFVADEIEDTVAAFLELVLKGDGPKVTTSQVATHVWGDLAGRWPSGAAERIAGVLRRLGWVSHVSHGRRYYEPSGPTPPPRPTSAPYGPRKLKAPHKR